MGTLAGVLAAEKIPTPEERFWADVEGDIESVNQVLKITRIRVTYHLRVSKEKEAAVQKAMATYLVRCPGAQSVIGCIDLQDRMVIEPE